MQKCYNCGKEVSDETLICPECGALVKRYTTPAPTAHKAAMAVRKTFFMSDGGLLYLS